MDLKNSMLLANMMSKSGGVEFKTYCYAQNNGCILIDKEVDGFRVVGTLVNTIENVNTYKSYYIGAGTTYSSNPTRWLGAFIWLPNNQKQKLVAIGYMGGNTTDELVNADGTIVKTDFDFERKSYSSYTISACGIFANYNIYNNSFNGYINDYVKMKEIILYKGNNIVADLKPAIVNGERGMYDTIEQKFYGNANSVGSLVCE
jgi:hypothetical protein